MASACQKLRPKGGVRGGCRLIFTTVGTHDAPFDRLVRRMDEVAGETDEPVWIQAGHSTITPARAPYRRFFFPEEYERLFKESRAIVSHAGVGTLLEAVQRQKPLVCVPRLRRFGEHWDDHQLEICRKLARAGTLHYLKDPDDLDVDVLSRAEPPEFPRSGTGLGERVVAFLQETARRTAPNGPHP